MFPRLLPITRALLIANVVVFLLQSVMADTTVAPFLLWPMNFGDADTPFGYSFQIWQLLTSGFMHASLPHLFFNMLALWMFGSPLEQTWGDRRFLIFYMVCLIGANFCQVLVATWVLSNSGQAYPALGASGATFGLLLGYGMLFPNNRMIVFPIPVEIRARTLVIIYGALALLLGVTGWQPGIAHFAHLGGMLFGWLLIRYWRGQPPFGKGRRGPPNIRIVR